MDYILMTDSNSDMPYEFRDQYDVQLVYMPYYMGEEERFSDLWRGSQNQELFDRMRAGEQPRTSLLPAQRYVEILEPYIKENNILFLAFSSQLSTTIDNLRMAREELLEKYPERTFKIVDTMNISGPEFMLYREAKKMQLAGKSLDEVAQWVEENKMRAHAWLTVEDLVYLKRGGRISGAAAFFGSMISLKPILVLGKNGKICPAEKIQGRKKALRTLVERTAQCIEKPEEQDIVVLHADSPEDGELLLGMIKQKLPNLRGASMVKVGPVVGTHCGPGTVAVCFFGKEREI